MGQQRVAGKYQGQEAAAGSIERKVQGAPSEQPLQGDMVELPRGNAAEEVAGPLPGLEVAGLRNEAERGEPRAMRETGTASAENARAPEGDPVAHPTRQSGEHGSDCSGKP